MPDNAPPEYSDRATLWNAVEKVEKAKNAQLAREIEIAIPAELNFYQQINLVREYVRRTFVDKGMCADICIHDKKDGNPHAHILLTMRPFNKDGTWGDKQKKEYTLGRNGDKIYDPMKRQYKCKSIPTTDWNEQTKAEEWRAAWADFANLFLEKSGHTERIDHRSYERQGVEQVPTVHLGPVAHQLEKRGIRTERGDINREVAAANSEIRQLRARINELRDWLKTELTNAPKALADIIEAVLQNRSQSYDDKSKLIGFLRKNDVQDYEHLQQVIDKIYTRWFNISDKTKVIEKRIGTLNENIKQGGYIKQYRSCKVKCSELHSQYTALQKTSGFSAKRRKRLKLQTNTMNRIAWSLHCMTPQ